MLGIGATKDGGTRRLRGRGDGGVRPTRDVPVRAIDRGGALTTADGAIVRALELTPLGALAASSDLAEDVLDGVAELLGRLAPGDALQWYAESRPVAAAELGAPRERTAALPAALGRLADADADRLQRIASQPAAVEQTTCLVVRTPAAGAARLARAGAAPGPFGSAHARALDRSLERVEQLAAELAALGLRPRLLDGPGMSRLLLRRLRGLGAHGSERRVEIVGALDERAEAQRSIAAAGRLLDLLRGVEVDFGDDRRVSVGGQLEQVVAVGGPPATGARDWLAALLASDQAYAVSIHVRAREDGLLDLGAYQSLCERGPTPDAVRLATAVDDVVRAAGAASSVRIDRGEFIQRALWPATLPLGIDPRHGAHRVDVRVAACALPLFADRCGSPGGVPFGRAGHGRLERLDPWDPVHRHACTLIAGGSTRERAETAGTLVTRLAADGAAVAVLDAEGELTAALTARLGDAAHAVEATDAAAVARLGAQLSAAAAAGAGGAGAGSIGAAAGAELGAAAAAGAGGAGAGPIGAAAGAGPRVVVLDARAAPTLLPCAGTAAALLSAAVDPRGGEPSLEAEPGRGALVVTGAERLLDEPGGADWLRRAATSARRDGCCLVLTGVEAAPYDASGLLDVAPVRVVLGHAPNAAAVLAERFGLAPTEARAIVLDRASAADDTPVALWLNGDRGRALVRLLDLPREEVAA